MTDLQTGFAAAADLPLDRDIARYLLIDRTNIAKADAAIICSNAHAQKELAFEGASLYHWHIVPKVVISGGRNGNKAGSEAEEIRNAMLNLGVPNHFIRIEEQATNTPENIRFSRALLEDEAKSPIQSVILSGSIVAGRRFLMTAAKEWPEVFAMATNVNPFPFPLHEWRTRPERSIVENEYRKIIQYKAAGDILEVDIEAINNRAATMARQQELGL